MKPLGLLFVCVHAESIQSRPALRNLMNAPIRLLCPRDYPGKNTSVVGTPSSRGSSQPGTEPETLTCPALAGWFFTTSTTWEASAMSKKQYTKLNLKIMLLGKWYQQTCSTEGSKSFNFLKFFDTYLQSATRRGTVKQRVPGLHLFTETFKRLLAINHYARL